MMSYVVAIVVIVSSALFCVWHQDRKILKIKKRNEKLSVPLTEARDMLCLQQKETNEPPERKAWQ